ncbi:alpha/beta hydrolase [Rhodococcus tukisamuensis]|uniref:Acetyl esterase n=1 Tax=Rhodococcus tukisamuensis TaxID=168276 RepID=A0A1G7EW48_9NOCA|nr:alpha/beta hydrolase [Rhodococcus tukisamuensis]SDE67645.1 acetyl esterase [Rhodococcus tukisamuensis]
MSLDAEVAALLGALNTGFPKVETMTGAQARATVRARLQLPAEPEPVGGLVEAAVPGPAGEIPVRIYRPASTSDVALPVVVFAHGGGFVFCDLDTHDGFCRAMSNGTGAVVVSVDYRLAPESPWPAAAEDVYAVLGWVHRGAAALGVDPDRIAVAGDSAGGNLAAVTALLTRDRGGPALAAQALLYPVIAADFDTESYRAYGEGYFNTRAAMQWYWDQYVPVADREHPYASPIRAQLAGLAPAVVLTAGFDPLCSEGDAYAEALAAEGVPVTHRRYDGAIHGFATIGALTIARRAQKQLWADLSELLGGAER